MRALQSGSGGGFSNSYSSAAMKWVTLGAPANWKSVHRLLHQAIGIGDALVLPQMLEP